MREAFHEQLDTMFRRPGRHLRAASRPPYGSRPRRCSTGDAAIAEQVISADVDIDRARERVEDTAFLLLSLQQPVASDLRTVVAALRMVSELERMGDLSVHVAKIARLRVPEPRRAGRGPPDHRADGRRSPRTWSAGSRKIITERDVDDALALVHADEEMDQLRRASFAELLSADWTHGVEAAVDVALLGRYYERIADHAVSVANRVVFVVTGENPRSTPEAASGSPDGRLGVPELERRDYPWLVSDPGSRRRRRRRRRPRGRGSVPPATVGCRSSSSS